MSIKTFNQTGNKKKLKKKGKFDKNIGEKLKLYLFFNFLFLIIIIIFFLGTWECKKVTENNARAPGKQALLFQTSTPYAPIAVSEGARFRKLT